jgi:hypothetical protein
MKKLLIIIVLIFASCDTEYDDPIEISYYDVLITEEIEIKYENMQGDLLNVSRKFDILFEAKNIRKWKLDKAIETYPELNVTMHEPLENNMIRITNKVVTHKIIKK